MFLEKKLDKIFDLKFHFCSFKTTCKMRTKADEIHQKSLHYNIIYIFLHYDGSIDN